ncbi:SBBP repeat-containing protein [Mechercharimyces sp. CAU 1602]|uniref:DUF7948 domain-containing protein n=1 Tax=Mechercharimyces sp. CAU 1602 TaxID=2973933 RepID=UPI002162B230|nr:SBBP repeat-containing protein [Mechercharimyces sp. CAU 1602]MCS1351642.1 SBBP repeat-containing protein [Mechercharimyces sp. CAU 1602]
MKTTNKEMDVNDVKVDFVHNEVNFSLIQSGVQQEELRYPPFLRLMLPKGKGVKLVDEGKRAVYEQIVPGVDMVFYRQGDQLKYDVIVSPGAEISSVRLTYEGATKMEVDKDGHLFLHTQQVLVKEEKPYSYQWIEGKKVEVEAGFVVSEGGALGFEVGEYDPRYSLVIDPVIFYSTLLGGSGFDGSDLQAGGMGIAVDTSGNAYVTGVTDSDDFPVTTGAFQTVNRGVSSAFVSKLNQTGSSLVYSTYLGGICITTGRGIAVDGDEAVAVGITDSIDFPITSGAFQTTVGGFTSAFITRLNSQGTSLVFSTYLGGEFPDSCEDIALDAEGNSYITGIATSPNFPVTSGAFQTILPGGGAAYATKLNATGSALRYSTFLGGAQSDQGEAIAVNNEGNAFVSGISRSTNFPVTSGAFQTQLRGSQNAFVTRLNPDGSGLVYSTYLGGSDAEDASAIAIDGGDQAYIVGSTSSTNFPVTSGAFQTLFPGVNSAYVCKLNRSGTAQVYSTYLGGSGEELGSGVAIDAFEGAWVTGVTRSANFPLTSDAFQDRLRGSADAFITQMSFAGTGISYSTYYGGDANDFGIDIAVQKNQQVAVVGFTLSTDFPTTPGAFQTENKSQFADAFVLKLGRPAPRGATGATGMTGPTGPRGPRGARGPRGKSNASGE